MDFFKKLFGEKEKTADKMTGETFTCENCKEERPVFQKKPVSEDKPQNVCEFC